MPPRAGDMYGGSIKTGYRGIVRTDGDHELEQDVERAAQLGRRHLRVVQRRALRETAQEVLARHGTGARGCR